MIVQAAAIYTSVCDFGCAASERQEVFFLLFRFEPHNVDRGGGKIGVDVRRIAFLDHPAYAIPPPGRMRKNSVLNEQLQQGGSTGVCRPRVG
jgi:hypothetical protein